MLSIQTDINSIKIRNYLSDVTDRLNSCTKKLSTGQKLNNASDDAAGLYLSSGLKTRINSLNIGIDASQTGTSILNIAEGSITNMQNAFQRIRDLAVQASSGYYTTDARQALQNEADALIAEINREKANCNFNGKELLTPSQSTATTDTTTSANSISSTSALQQITIDDFTNVVTTTLEEISEIWTEEQFNESTWGSSSLTYEQYVAKCHEFLDVSIQKGEKDGQTYYFIENADQLKSAIAGEFADDYGYFLSVHSSANFVFLSDIDLNGVEWGRYNNYSEINGNGHKISNYHSDANGSALIYRNDGTIKNLSMENCSASGSDSAILCYYNYYGSITDCYVTDSTASGRWSAILCHGNWNIISDCYVTESTASGDYSAILCYDNEGTISDCYVTESTALGDYSAILCYENWNTISDCYVTDSTVSGNESAILCYKNECDIFNCYTLNITADSSMKCVNYQYCSVNNNYQNHNESDDTSTYQSTEWFAREDAVTTLGNAFEMVEGKDHPTLKSNPEPVPPTPPTPTGEGMRIQVGEDASGSSYLELDLGFDFGVISIDLSTAASAASAINTVDGYLKTLNDKQSLIGASYNRLESVAQSNAVRAENLSASRSTIVDADIAKENSQYVKSQILQSASTSLLAQTANINSQIILGLLSNI